MINLNLTAIELLISTPIPQNKTYNGGITSAWLLTMHSSQLDMS